MTLGSYLPVQVPNATTWAVADYSEKVISAPADGTGRALVRFEQVPADEIWLIDRIVVSNDGAAASTAKMYNGSENAMGLRDQTSYGNGDVGDMSSPMLLTAGAELLVVWAGCTAASTSTAHVQWRRMRRVRIGGAAQ